MTFSGPFTDQAPWMSDAACGSSDPEAFFPENGRDRGRNVYAKQICAGCPVKEICLQYALTEDIWYGIWGGLSAHERHELRIKIRRIA